MAFSALSNERQTFSLYITHVDGDGPFLKISGQVDLQSICLVESLIRNSIWNFEKGIGGIVSAASIRNGVICAAKCEDGAYYRAKVINTTDLAKGIVGVHFIDFGKTDHISVSAIRFLDKYNPLLLDMPGQSSDFYLAKTINPSKWEELHLLKLRRHLCCYEFPVTILSDSSKLPFISIQFQGKDLSQLLEANRYALSISVEQQEVLLSIANSLTSYWQPGLSNEQGVNNRALTSFIINSNFPSNPASTVRLPYNAPYLTTTIPPSDMSQRLAAHRVSRVAANMRTSAICLSQSMFELPPTFIANPQSPPNQMYPIKSTYKMRSLEVNSEHKVFISCANDGPGLFVVQLVNDRLKLDNMMNEINKYSYNNLNDRATTGTVCLARMALERIMCRAIVTDVSNNACRLFFVDFGNTETVPYDDIFDIPEEYVKHNIFAFKFCLSGFKKLNNCPKLKETFKEIVEGKVLTLKVVPAEGIPLIQYGELHLYNQNVFDLLSINIMSNLSFKYMDPLPAGTKKSVLVSYVDSCLKFFVQLSDQIDSLNSVMDDVKTHCQMTKSPGVLAVGSVCCAKFPYDGNWYRASVVEVKGDKVVVLYVDYGNEQELMASDLRTITPDLLQLPAQALKCALKGFENKPVETETSYQLEMLVLDKTLMAHVVGTVSKDVMLVSLVDDTVLPLRDIARKVTQLCRCSTENKGPPRKDATPFSAPEGNNENGERGNFQRDNFKEERGRKDLLLLNDDFSLRSGNFREKHSDNRFNRLRVSDENKFEDRRNKFDRLENRPDRRDYDRDNRRDHRDDSGKDWGNRDSRRDGREGGRDAGHSNCSPHYSAKMSFGDENKSDESFGSYNYRNINCAPFKGPITFTPVQYKEIPNPVSLDTPYVEPSIELHSQHEVSITWIVSPENFYTQTLSLQPKFLEMMYKIAEMYKGVKPYEGTVTPGSSVLAKYPEDGVLYRARVLSCHPFGKYVVQYIDVGNKFSVEPRDIWQLDHELMELPKMAIHCSLASVSPLEGGWKLSPELLLCFNAPQYHCVFLDRNKECHRVSLWNNGVSVADLLLTKGLSLPAEQTLVRLKELQDNSKKVTDSPNQGVVEIKASEENRQENSPTDLVLDSPKKDVVEIGESKTKSIENLLESEVCLLKRKMLFEKKLPKDILESEKSEVKVSEEYHEMNNSKIDKIQDQNEQNTTTELQDNTKVVPGGPKRGVVEIKASEEYHKENSSTELVVDSPKKDVVEIGESKIKSIENLLEIKASEEYHQENSSTDLVVDSPKKDVVEIGESKIKSIENLLEIKASDEYHQENSSTDLVVDSPKKDVVEIGESKIKSIENLLEIKASEEYHQENSSTDLVVDSPKKDVVEIGESKIKSIENLLEIKASEEYHQENSSTDLVVDSPKKDVVEIGESKIKSIENLLEIKASEEYHQENSSTDLVVDSPKKDVVEIGESKIKSIENLLEIKASDEYHQENSSTDLVVDSPKKDVVEIGESKIKSIENLLEIKASDEYHQENSSTDLVVDSPKKDVVEIGESKIKSIENLLEIKASDEYHQENSSTDLVVDSPKKDVVEIGESKIKSIENLLESEVCLMKTKMLFEKKLTKHILETDKSKELALSKDLPTDA